MQLHIPPGILYWIVTGFIVVGYELYHTKRRTHAVRREIYKVSEKRTWGYMVFVDDIIFNRDVYCTHESVCTINNLRSEQAVLETVIRTFPAVSLRSVSPRSGFQGITTTKDMVTEYRQILEQIGMIEVKIRNVALGSLTTTARADAFLIREVYNQFSADINYLERRKRGGIPFSSFERRTVRDMQSLLTVLAIPLISNGLLFRLEKLMSS